MSLREASGSRERNIEVLLLTGAAGFAVLGWYALRAAEIALPASTGRILTQFAASGLVAHVAGRMLAPRARPEILAVSAFLAAVGLVFVMRLAPEVAADQANWVSVGAVAFTAGLWMGTRYPRLKQYTYTSGVAAIVVLVATGVFGTTINGARLWVEVAGQSVQTTELIKVFVIVFLAGYLADAASVVASPTLRAGDRTYSGAAYLVPLAVVLFGAVGALALLRDLGSIAILLLLAVGALYLATGRARFVLGGIGLLAATGIMGYVLFGHVQVRIETWLDPGADPAGTGYQAMQATYAIQAGGITGAGPGLGQPDAVPAAPTDYIYTAIAEELGLAGATGVALLYVALLYAGLRVSAEAGDTYGRLLAACIALLMAIQAAVIIAGNLRMIPTTGITLPYVSYGGSSLVVNFGLAGLLAGISHVSRRGLTARRA
jgi:cell division protein FtsW (lipid II flippase)